MQPIEHALTKAEAEFFASTREQDRKLQEEYFSALGRVKDVEMRSDANAAARNTQLQIIVKNAGLPAGKLRLSPDGLTLIVELVAAVPPPTPLASTQQPAPAANGQEALKQ